MPVAGAPSPTALQQMIPNQAGWVVLAWMLRSPLMENLAGFRIPIAIVAPMLILLGVIPVRAVAAVAVGHSWAVSLGGMALALRTMTDITGLSETEVFPSAAILLGVCVLLTGLASAWLLNQLHFWKRIVLLSLIVAMTQFLVGYFVTIPLSSFSAAIVGVLAGMLLGMRPPGEKIRAEMTPQLQGGLVAYGFLFVSIILVSVIQPLNRWLAGVRLNSNFPEVVTNHGVVTAAGPGFISSLSLTPGSGFCSVLLWLSCFCRALRIQKKPILARRSQPPDAPACRLHWAPFS